eukprot:GHVS01078323.1.p1 GENE.GHVS01078323.1~~GHVS01078323.1.p1  ORF type:complete len:266 (+),score=17.20 GHVS01078323.1:109-798(+)
MVVFSVLAFVCLGLLPSTSSGNWAPIDQTTIGHVAQSAGQHERHPAANPAQTAHQATPTNLPSTRPRSLMKRNERQRATDLPESEADLPESEAAALPESKKAALPETTEAELPETKEAELPATNVVHDLLAENFRDTSVTQQSLDANSQSFVPGQVWNPLRLSIAQVIRHYVTYCRFRVRVGATAKTNLGRQSWCPHSRDQMVTNNVVRISTSFVSRAVISLERCTKNS